MTAREPFSRITWTHGTLSNVVSRLRSDVYVQHGQTPPLPPELEAVDALPSSEPDKWEWRQPLPATWKPEIKMGSRRIEVVFHTHTGLHREKIVRHRDLFYPGRYCPARHCSFLTLSTFFHRQPMSPAASAACLGG
ncbi:hypothetical protein [Polyangium aurulentum]|uniref:hypothetical protein n=1 Tax=Polyangium aurulentum TaxID=2567896 RepID=UPI0010AE6F4E|nr:hypothetical protein [Polyangium aurulentum]UQA60462.1 hypothetical protein E8A73_008315 [Polyangium aurulentum]